MFPYHFRRFCGYVGSTLYIVLEKTIAEEGELDCWPSKVKFNRRSSIFEVNASESGAPICRCLKRTLQQQCLNTKTRNHISPFLFDFYLLFGIVFCTVTLMRLLKPPFWSGHVRASLLTTRFSVVLLTQ